MRNLGFVRKRVQALLGDPRGSWVTKGYIDPFIDQAYGDVVLDLGNASGKNLEGVVILAAVPAGITSLYPWQNSTAVPGQPPAANNPPALLQGLYDPLEVWVKPAGAPVQCFSKVSETGTLPHVDPLFTGQNSLGPAMFWNWMGNELRITPVNQPLDIEVTGKFGAQPLVDDTDLLSALPDIWLPVSYLTPTLAGVERSNPQVLAGYGTQYMSTRDNCVAQIIRQGQSTPARWQKFARSSGRSQWYWT